MAASPPNRFARRDLRPPAGANPELPGFAEGDHVLHKWVLEERARRRRFLADQVLEPCEPFDPVRHPYRPLKPFYNAYQSFNRATGWRFHPFMRSTAFMFGIFVLPAWFLMYKEKQWRKTGQITESKPPKYPDHDLAEHGHHH